MKIKSKNLENLIKSKSFDYVDSDITSDNFPQEEIRSSDYKLFHFGRLISSEDAVKEVEKEGYSVANIYELLDWKEWNGSDSVVALGSFWEVNGLRDVSCLDGRVAERGLSLFWWKSGWSGRYRFLAVRTVSLIPEKSDTLEKRVEDLEE